MISSIQEIISPSQSHFNQMSHQEMKFESNNNSLLNVSDRNDSKQEFIFRKSILNKNKSGGLAQGRSDSMYQDNPLLNSNQQKIQQYSPFKSGSKTNQNQYTSEDFRADSLKQNIQISDFVRHNSSNSEMNAENTNNNQKSPFENQREVKAKGGRKLNQIHSIQKSPTLQYSSIAAIADERERQRFLRTNSSAIKKSSLQTMTDYPKDGQFAHIKSLKQKLSFFSALNSHTDKTDSTMVNPTQRRQSFRWNIVSKFENVIAFVNILKNTTTLMSSYRSLNRKHHELINDKADINNDEQLTSGPIASKLKFIFDSTISKIPIFLPESPRIIFWNFLVVLSILVQFVAIPLKICFFIEFTGLTAEIILFYLPAFVFFSEIFLRLNISYYQDGIIIQSRYKIIDHYMFQSYFFWLDLITTIIFLISKNSNHPFLISIVVLRFLQFSQLVNDIDEHYQITQRFSSFWNLLKLLLTILIVAHFTGCGFHYIGYIQSENAVASWLDRIKIFNEDWQVRYLNSVYWASITMITVGYGDIVPVTSAEKIYVIIMTLISAGIFAYSVNTIGAIIGDIQKQKLVKKTQKRNISTYMRSRGINGQLQIEVLKYLENVKQEEIEITKKGQEVISILSSSIQEKLQSDYYGRILQESKIFKGYSSQFLQEVAYIMKEQLSGPGEIIFTLGQHDNRMLFVTKGKVQLFLPHTKNKKTLDLQILEKGEIGHYGFFAEQPRSTSLRSLNVSQIVYISREEFLTILQKFPLDQERFCQTKDLILQQQQKNNIKCFACEVKGHSIINCSRIHFKRDKYTLILKYNYSQEQLRADFNRKNKEKKNTYSVKKQVRESLLKLRGQKMSEIYQIEFLKEDFEWLERNKDIAVFQVIPKLYYENGVYGIHSDHEYSQYSEEVDSNNSDFQFSEDSDQEQSYSNNTPKQQMNIYQNIAKKLNIQDDLSDIERYSRRSSQIQNSSNHINSPILAPLQAKKESQLTSILNSFNKKKPLKQKTLQTKQLHQSNQASLSQRRKSAFCFGGVQNNILTNHLQIQEKLNDNLQESDQLRQSKRALSEKNIESPKQNIKEIEEIEESVQSKQVINKHQIQYKNQNYILKEEESVNDSQYSSKNMSNKGSKVNKLEQSVDKELLFSTKVNEVLGRERIFNKLQKKIQIENKVAKLQNNSNTLDGSLKIQDVEDSNDQNIIPQNNTQDNLTEKSLQLYPLQDEVDQLPFNRNLIQIDPYSSNVLTHLDLPSPIIKLEDSTQQQQQFQIGQSLMSSQQQNTCTSNNNNKHLISFQNLYMSSDIISEEKTNSSQTKKSREMLLSRKNQQDIETNKTILSSFAARTGHILEQTDKYQQIQSSQGGENDQIINGMKFSSKTLSNRILSPIIQKITGDEQKYNNLQIPFIQSINEIVNEENPEFLLDDQVKSNDLQESQKDNSNKSNQINLEKEKENSINDKYKQEEENNNQNTPQLEEQEQNDKESNNPQQLKTIINLNENNSPKNIVSSSIKPKPKLFIQFNDSERLNDSEEAPQSVKKPLTIFSKEDRLKMLKSKNSSMRDIFQKKQEIQKSRFAQLQNQNTNQQVPAEQNPIKFSPTKQPTQGNYFNFNSNQMCNQNNNLNISINQGIQPSQIQSPSFHPLALKQIQNQLNQSSHSIASPYNSRDKKESNIQLNQQLQLLQQMHTAVMAQLGSIQQQQQLQAHQKQPSTSQTIQNAFDKSPMSSHIKIESGTNNIQHSDLLQQQQQMLQQQIDDEEMNNLREQFYIVNTDGMKQYAIYFPQNNFTNVIKLYNNSTVKRSLEYIKKNKRKIGKEQKKTVYQSPSKFNLKRSFRQTSFNKTILQQ